MGSVSKLGFDGRMFLSAEEHATYMRRMPVRYIKRPKGQFCEVCGLPATSDNPLEHAHKIPFGTGVRIYKLTPDWLDGPHNTMVAHKRTCNKAAELPHLSILALLAQTQESPQSGLS